MSNSVYNIPKKIKKEDFLPIYFFCGVDTFAIEEAVGKVKKSAERIFGTSEFDSETIRMEKGNSVPALIDLASAFPFSSEKKIILVKSFEHVNDKKEFADYVKNPADFTILIIIQNGRVPNLNSEPFKSLSAKGYLYEAKELKGRLLIKWIVEHCKSIGLKITEDNAHTLMEFVGEDKLLIESQIQKFIDFIGERTEITLKDINELASKTKEHSIFEFLEAMGQGNSSKALTIGYNLLNNGKDIIFILSMLSKYVTTLAHSLELGRNNVPDKEAARKAGASFYYYLNCKKARFLRNDNRLLHASRVLFETDFALKTSAVEQKTLLTILVSKIISGVEVN